jgi:AcrR family transcriptional regulator
LISPPKWRIFSLLLSSVDLILGAALGRRSDHTLEQIKQMAVEAAEKIVRKKGIEELSTRKIAAEIGYTSGTLYLVFKNLDDLILHVNGRTLERLRDALTAVTARAGDPVHMAKEICRSYLRFADENRAFWSLVYERRWPADFRRPVWYQSLIGQCFAPMVAALKAAAPAKTEAELNQAAQAIWAMVHGTHALWSSASPGDASSSPAAGLVEYQLEVFFRGFLA